MMRLCRPNGQAAPNRREWDAVWMSGTTAGVAVEDLSMPGPDRVRALMVAAAVTDAFLAELEAAREPYVLARLADTPHALVSPSQLGSLNGGRGLNLLIAYMGWEGDVYHEAPAPNLRAILVNAFADRHGGNRLRLLLGEVGGPALLDLTTRSGCRILNDYAAWAGENDMLEAPKRPYLMGVSREDALRIENQWMTRMFTYFPPVFHFTELQRQILVLAREGHTDAEIGDQLGVSADAVKKRWGGIYDRVGEVFPRLLPESPLGGRGAEKRRALLAHLRERPEELRAHAPADAVPR
ncbi:MAG: hypothetical protein ACO1SV_25415 [Fimbriimonas sp.]